MIIERIKDSEGGELYITKTRLQQGDWLGVAACFLRLKDLKKAVDAGDLEIPLRFAIIECAADKEFFPAGLDVDECRIGCCTFSPATFAKILKAAGVRKTNKVARKKKRAKN